MIEDLAAARLQMALSLGWHIVIASFGVGMPAVTVFAEWRGHRTGDPVYTRLAHRWAKAMGVLAGVAVLAADAPDLYAGLRGQGLPVAAASVVAGVASLVLIATGRYRLVRVTAAVAVAAMLWAWAAAQYPLLLPPDLTVDEAAGDPTVLRTVLAALGVGALLLVPSLLWLFTLFQRTPRH